MTRQVCHMNTENRGLIVNILDHYCYWGCYPYGVESTWTQAVYDAAYSILKSWSFKAAKKSESFTVFFFFFFSIVSLVGIVLTTMIAIHQCELPGICVLSHFVRNETDKIRPALRGIYFNWSSALQLKWLSLLSVCAQKVWNLKESL